MARLKLAAILLVAGLVGSQAQAWQHWVYNDTGKLVSVLAVGIANPNNQAVDIPADGQRHIIDMGIYCTQSFEITGLEGLSVTLDNPAQNKCPGQTIRVYKDEDFDVVDKGNYLEKTKKVRLKVTLDGYKEPYYSEYKKLPSEVEKIQKGIGSITITQ